MKRIITAMALTACIYTLSGCNSCTQTMKNIESDFAELDRDVTVLNAITGDTIFSYSGPCYIDGSANPGDVTLLYYQGKKAKKADFIGHHIMFIATEK